MIKMVRGVSSQVKIDIAIIIVIARRDSHAERVALQASALSDIFKRAVCFLVIKPIPELGIVLIGHSGLRHWVLQQGAVREK